MKGKTMNEAHISGWTFKPETKKLSSGKDLIRFALKYGNGKDKDGKWQNAFIPVKIFTDGLTIEDNQQVEVWGRIACDEWTDKQGQKRNTTYLSAMRIETKEQKKKDVQIEDSEMPF